MPGASRSSGRAWRSAAGRRRAVRRRRRCAPAAQRRRGARFREMMLPHLDAAYNFARYLDPRPGRGRGHRAGRLPEGVPRASPASAAARRRPGCSPSCATASSTGQAGRGAPARVLVDEGALQRRPTRWPTSPTPTRRRRRRRCSASADAETAARGDREPARAVPRDPGAARAGGAVLQGDRRRRPARRSAR